jgi:hypothetical protein
MSPTLCKRLGCVLVLLVGCDGATSKTRSDAALATDAAELVTDAAEAQRELPDGGAEDSSEPSDADAPTDASLAAEADASADASGTIDAASEADANLPPRKPVACSQPCNDTEACLDGSCLPRCGADVDALRAALSPLLKVHFAICDTGAAVQAVPRDSLSELYVRDGRTLVFGYRSDSTGPFTPSVEVTPTIEPGSTLLPSPFLLAAHSANLIFGYTTSAPGAPGGLFVVPKLSQLEKGTFELNAPGIRAATLAATPGAFNPDLFFVIADALGATHEGVGVYRGSFDAAMPSLALRGAGVPQSVLTLGNFRDFLLVSALPGEGATWPDGGDDARVFAMPLSAVYGPSIDVFTHDKVQRFAGLPAELEAGRFDHEVAFITRDPDAHTIATLDVREYKQGPISPGFSPPIRWVSGGSFTTFTRTGYSGVMLRHAHGTWFVRADP